MTLFQLLVLVWISATVAAITVDMEMWTTAGMALGVTLAATGLMLKK
mgnify:CR=1 FL=1